MGEDIIENKKIYFEVEGGSWQELNGIKDITIKTKKKSRYEKHKVLVRYEKAVKCCIKNFKRFSIPLEERRINKIGLKKYWRRYYGL